MLDESNEDIQVVDAVEPSPTDLTFITTETSSYDDTLPNSSAHFIGKENSADNVIADRTKEFMSSKGLGWMLEVDDQDDDVFKESLLEELDIDLWSIASRIRGTLFPLHVDKVKLVQNPDFWGPLAVVCAYAFILLWGQIKAPVVSWVVTIWFFGSLIIFILGRALGSEITFSSSLGVIGYSLLPISLTVILLGLTSFEADGHEYVGWLVRILGTCWSTFSASTLLSTQELGSKRILFVYPVLLLFIYFMSMESGV